MNATITITYDGKSETFELDGTELSQGWDASGAEPIPSHLYLGNASRSFIADMVEKALLKLTNNPITKRTIHD